MKTTKIKTSVFVVLCTAFFFVSCTNNTIYHHYVKIDEGGWHKDSAAVFNVDITDTVGDYNVVVDIRNLNNYPYQNLHLFIYSYAPDNFLVGDSLDCYLANNQGKWQGSGIGSTKDLPILYMKDINFPQSGTYTFKIYQGMRDEVLKGISDIGLSIRKVE